jgi:ADP-ribose pyrophosphatase YjhB (NUDIX family)
MLMKATARLLARPNWVTIGVQAAVFDDQDRVLLVRHGYRPGWHFPGGGVERGETLRQALDRELEEETGVRLTAEPQLFALYSHFDEFPGDHIALYVVRHWSRTRVPVPNHEIKEGQFFGVRHLPPAATAPTCRRLNEILLGAERSPSW